MKILHTSDWHLGATLGQYSRIEEQQAFIDQLCDIIHEQNVRLVLIAGDIFDTYNPPAAAEQLFYAAMARLAAMGIFVVAIAGNHDSHDRFAAPAPLAHELGIKLIATPECINLNIDGQEVIIAAMPYISEKRINQVIFQDLAGQTEAQMQKEFSEKVGEIFDDMSKQFRADTVNIAMGHFHLYSGKAEGGERDIVRGGTFAVDYKHLPKNAQYIALGHLHNAQKIGENTYYSGSPLPYYLSKQVRPKAVYVAELHPGASAKVEKIILNCPKPIELWEEKTAADALERCALPSNAYVYIYITQEVVISADIVKEMHRLKEGIVDIVPAHEKHEIADKPQFSTLGTTKDEFVNFYVQSRGAHPVEELLEFFDEFLEEGDSE